MMRVAHTDIDIVLVDRSRTDQDARINLANHSGVTGQDSLRSEIALMIANAEELRKSVWVVAVVGADADGFSCVGAAKILIQEVLKFLRTNKQTSMTRITICLSDQPAFEIFDQTIRGYVRHLQDDLAWGPYVTVDIIIELPQGIVLIERSNPPYGWALPGGFVDYGESIEHAAVREAKEETNLNLIGLRQFHTYSDPGRDPRFQTVSTVFIAQGHGHPQSGDDAKGLTIIPREELLNRVYAFDHGQIIKDYLNSK